MVKVLFVCLGNICRSPMAKGVFQHLVKKEGLDHLIEIDACGLIDYHAGSNPDHRTLKVIQDQGIELRHAARCIKISDFYYFDYILAMDRENLRELNRLKPHDSKVLIELLRHWDDNEPDMDVPDPYFGNLDGFMHTYALVERSCRGILNELKITLK